MRPKIVPIRALAACVALLLVAGQALGTLHQVLVQHAVCAEHGELIDADGHATAQPLRANDSDPNAAIHAAEQAHGHEHCGVVGGTHQNRLALASSAREAVPAAASSSRALVDCQAVRSGTDILLFAPKLSPPV